MGDVYSSSSINQSVENYLTKFEKHLQNPVIKSFLDIQENMDLLVDVINNPTNVSKKKLDDTFREYYFKIRFTNYLSKAIYFNAINFDKKVNLFLDRNKSILDSQLKEGDNLTLIDYLVSKEWQEGQEVWIDSSNIADHLTSYSLYKAIHLLTENQRQLLNLAYIYDLNDSEIAIYLNKSQQAVSRSHKKALKKLREIIENG
ncbi:sigma factor-like helix-turn-helix DNA-binding protein [Paenisporosarcina sp. OV554]|uniref:sigma factor-like helix-turn-helix DNA-binding protein n=1 Tax=Paenisporosarcina sp. OV554 TaxID=2135694 RepID=UPI000D3D2C3D|nr:sigma factor-like helix-turn-helix DNA-binding protein [Paenisporosarcina sp. OV554]PUB11934.1 RNA polymerase sigma factor (sigma-70 family) [Paenisporosarcina sp. OV554]